ncbi:MAG: YqjF family protein [Planctomycetota bacterium]
MSDRTAGYQRWANLTFLHWRVPAERIQRQLPAGLEVDTYGGEAWLGVVPFSMERVRPWWSPAVPGISWFLETNVRTYVRGPGGVSGVWFFSLDANQRLAVELARRLWNLPYFRAELSLGEREERAGGKLWQHVECAGRRIEQPEGAYSIVVRADAGNPQPATAGTLEHFLVERYVLFCVDARGRMFSGRVHHVPYRICPVHQQRVEQTLTGSVGAGLECPGLADHATWSPGVDVRISPLTRCDR